MKIFGFAIVACLHQLANSQLFYPSSGAAAEGSTNTISYSTVFSICQCDYTPGHCDPLCCCDPDCDDTQKTYWEQNFGHTCGGFVSDATEICYRSSMMYKVNLRKGLMKTSSPDSRTECIRGGHIKENEFIGIETLTETEIADFELQAQNMANLSLTEVSQL